LARPTASTSKVADQKSTRVEPNTARPKLVSGFLHISSYLMCISKTHI
jgi:hypothetical protein